MNNDSDKIAFKQKIRSVCLELLKQRINNATQAMTQAQESANSNEKSSVGDKHETGRAIGQAERDMNAKQLLIAKNELGKLETIETATICNKISIGSVFKIDGIQFFVAIGLGSINVDGSTVMVISHQSPLFNEIKEKVNGNQCTFRGATHKIEEVF